eukprot:4907995-Pleurochrysis_carterae.AAC.1
MLQTVPGKPKREYTASTLATSESVRGTVTHFLNRVSPTHSVHLWKNLSRTVAEMQASSSITSKLAPVASMRREASILSSMGCGSGP